MTAAFVAGAASAARALGYRRMAELIETDGLDAEGIVDLFTLGNCKTRWRDTALIVLAGSVARYRAQPEGWSSEPERELVLALLRQHGISDAQFKNIAKRASALLVKTWPQIAATGAFKGQ
jgi:hypothetical protein